MLGRSISDTKQMNVRSADPLEQLNSEARSTENCRCILDGLADHSQQCWIALAYDRPDPSITK